ALRLRCEGHLLPFRRAFHGEGRRGPTRDHLAHFVEVFRPDKRLVLDRAIPSFAGSELLVLQVRVRGHPAFFVIHRKLEHGHVPHPGMSAYGAYARPRAIAAESPPSMRKNPSAVLSPVRNAWSLGSASLVTRRTLFASVRATRTVGTPMTSEARRAATSFWMN